jgi:hypothetical protein
MFKALLCLALALLVLSQAPIESGDELIVAKPRSSMIVELKLT